MKTTSIDPEEKCQFHGQFRRIAKAYHSKTGELVKCRAALPDTFFSIPATTRTEHGFITFRDDGELEFIPHMEQTESPLIFRRNYRKSCK